MWECRPKMFTNSSAGVLGPGVGSACWLVDGAGDGGHDEGLTPACEASWLNSCSLSGGTACIMLATRLITRSATLSIELSM